MTQRTAEAPPRPKARIAGFFYLLTFLMGVFELLASGGIVVSGNAAATAANILAHESLFRLGWAANLLAAASYVAVTALFYELFAPVNRSLSRLAAFFSLVGCAIGGASGFVRLAPLAILGGGAQSASVFSTEQSQALASTFLRLYNQAYGIGLVFFGFYCLLIGYLIYRSTFLPRFLGVLMMIAGLGWLTSLWPPLTNSLYPYILLPGVLGEGALTLWLLIAGVNEPRWNEQEKESHNV
jgi:hypothetical protein